MTGINKKRRRYYDRFSHIYDWFIRTHSRRDEDETRKFLADHAEKNISAKSMSPTHRPARAGL